MTSPARPEVLAYEVTVTRDQLVAHQALRWFGIAPPRFYDLKMAEHARARVQLERRVPLFPPPPPARAS